MSFRRIAAGLAVAAAVVPAAASAQANEQPPPQVREWIAEMQQIQMQIMPVQQQAMQDTALQEEQAAVTAAVREAIVEADPAMEAKLDRMDELMVEARAAQAAQDQEKLVELTQEAQTLQPEIASAQADALDRPDVEAKVLAFRDKLQARMVEIDPETKPLLERLQELDRLIGEAMEGLAD